MRRNSASEDDENEKEKEEEKEKFIFCNNKNRNSGISDKTGISVNSHLKAGVNDAKAISENLQPETVVRPMEITGSRDEKKKHQENVIHDGESPVRKTTDESASSSCKQRSEEIKEHSQTQRMYEVISSSYVIPESPSTLDRECSSRKLDTTVLQESAFARSTSTDMKYQNFFEHQMSIQSPLSHNEGNMNVHEITALEKSRAENLTVDVPEEQTVECSRLENKETCESEDEDEEDIDFNPFLLQSPSPEASSGLSTESEDVEEENDISGGLHSSNHERSGFAEMEMNISDLNCRDEDGDFDSEDENNDDLLEKSSSLDCSYRDSRRSGTSINMRNKPSRTECSDAAVCMDNGCDEEYTGNSFKDISPQNSRDFAALSTLNGSTEDDDIGVERCMDDSLKVDEHVDDAICKRTRAHYSLADMSLDELEAFLQESDEEDFFQNVDDEEEYRKFVAAVQGSSNEGAGVDDQGGSRQGEEEEDDEEDDDFEIELEEALESDYEEICEEQVRKRRRRSVCSQKRDKKKHGERLLGSAKTPLRPLLPSGVCKNTVHDSINLLQDSVYKPKPASYGFTACQRRQLQCLIHEHVQLLVQVFSLTVLDPSRQQIAADTRRLLLQMADTRAQVILWKKPPFPEVCLCPHYVHASTSKSEKTAILGFLNVSGSNHNTKLNGCDFNLQNTPKKSVGVHSLLDIAPLALVNEFLADIEKAVEIGNQHRLLNPKEMTKKPLFPNTVVKNNQTTAPDPSQPKKTMAAALVEYTKLNGIALVPQEISVAVSRFIGLFNPEMFPYKPPAAAIANRLLFSEAEDELLAMGIMLYNNNWEKIQQHFLPSKTTHQIFVRQKNRSTTRAPENSIKAVRRLKSSPLTKDEQSRIEEGLKIFKSDWIKVWEHCVPYRDPATLSRLWRAAQGIQRSYSGSTEAKEKHRIAEKIRRSKKALDAANEDNQDGDEVNSEDDTCEGSTDAYLHEAFLTNWNPKDISAPVTDSVPENSRFPYMRLDSCSMVPHQVQNMAKSAYVMPNYSGSNTVSNPANSGVQSCKTKNAGHSQMSHMNVVKGPQIIKLAPGLPSLNLPPCVRVISQAEFNNHQRLAGNIGNHVYNGNANMQKRNKTTASPSNVYSQIHRSGISHVDAPSAMMHPFLMQATFDSGTVQKSSSIAGQTSSQNIPRFRPFVPGSKTKSLFTSNAQAASNEYGSVELHPFLQDDSNFPNTVRNTTDPVTSSVKYDPILRNGQIYMSNRGRPLSISDSVIRPEPRRPMHLSSRQRLLSDASNTENCLTTARKDDHLEPRLKDTARHDDGLCLELGLRSAASDQNNIDLCRPVEEHPSDQGGSDKEQHIVMEQEELSDSDTQSVQFECEEIEDSDRDVSDTEEHGFEPEKATEDIEFEEEEIGSDDSDNER